MNSFAKCWRFDCKFQAVSEHPDVVEAAVVGKSDKLKGQLPVGLCVLKAGMFELFTVDNCTLHTALG